MDIRSRALRTGRGGEVFKVLDRMEWMGKQLWLGVNWGGGGTSK